MSYYRSLVLVYFKLPIAIASDFELSPVSIGLEFKLDLLGVFFLLLLIFVALEVYKTLIRSGLYDLGNDVLTAGPLPIIPICKGPTLHYLSLILEVAVHQITGLIFIEILHSTWVDDPLQSGKWRVPLNPAIVFPSVPFAGVDLKRNVLLHQSQNLMKILF